MTLPYANDFTEIPAALAGNPPLRERMAELIACQPVAGKVTEDGDRLARLRVILLELTAGALNVHQAIRRVETDLPRAGSLYAANNKVFADGWAERLVRTQYSRFYNQAVLEHLLTAGAEVCFVPHSTSEDPKSQCSAQLAGRTHSPQSLHARLVASYADGNWSKEPKVPDHPHCTHVVTPKRAGD